MWNENAPHRLLQLGIASVAWADSSNVKCIAVEGASQHRRDPKDQPAIPAYPWSKKSLDQSYNYDVRFDCCDNTIRRDHDC